MAFYTNLIALSWLDDNYAVVSKITADVDTASIKRDGLFNNVSQNSSYFDEAAILGKKGLEKYLSSESGQQYKAAASWHASLPNEACFIVVHRAEWESGLGD